MRCKFESPGLRALCCSKAALLKKFGEKTAVLIQRRLVWLDAARSLADVSTEPPLRRRLEDGGRQLVFSVCALDAGRIYFVPEWSSTEPANENDLACIEAIKIVQVGGNQFDG